jgi:hypothetical protein
MRRNPRFRMLVLATFLLLVISIAYVSASAEDDLAPPPQGTSNDSCYACHDSPGLQIELDSGEPLYLTVERDVYDNSVHGKLGYACVQCHTNISGFPHPERPGTTRRTLSLELYTSCANCHADKYQSTLDSVHDQAIAAGNLDAAICTDCHGAHDITPPDEPRSKIPKTCEKCHSQIYDLYKDSVHGEALIGEGNPDVPTCIDCHGVHDVEGPSNSPFRLFSPTICAKCHADPELMGKYGISTEVFDTYISDFHGTTVLLFEKIAPDQETNKPVCIDCHGVHDIRAPNDPESRVIKENLLSTCQRCHPDATTNFPSSWLSHYQPSPEEAPLVFGVNVFYAVIIPTIIGGMILYVGLDAGRRILNKRKRRDSDHG